ncbi:MAG: phospholipase D-like domain-containing protein [Leptospirales bacterium]
MSDTHPASESDSKNHFHPAQPDFSPEYPEYMDPEIRQKNEQFAMIVMSISFVMILGMIFGMTGLTSALMADQAEGLRIMGWGMAIFTASSLLHLLVSRIWMGSLVPGQAARNSYLLVPSLVCAIAYLYALFSDTAFVFVGFIGGNLFFPLFGKYILSMEHPAPPSRPGSFQITPFSRVSLATILLIGIIIGLGIGMSASGSQSIGRGLFARTVVSEKLLQSRKSIHMIVFQFIKPYRILEALRQDHSRGLRIRILVRPETLKENRDTINTLLKDGISVRVLPPDTPKWLRPYTVLDDRILLQGSKGWSDHPVPFQRQLTVQASLLLFERIRKMDHNFDVIWNHSTQLKSLPPD